jgi:hypothetical protein
MHKFPNSFHIFGGDTRGRSSRSLVFKGRSSAFEAPVPLETLRTTHCLIAISLLKHVQCLCDQFAQFNAKFHVGSLFHLSVHDVITDYHTRDHKNTNITTPDVNTAMSLGTLPFQDSRSLQLRAQPCAAICWRATELIRELFDTATYVPSRNANVSCFQN